MSMSGKSGDLLPGLKVFRSRYHGCVSGIESFVDRPNEIAAAQIDELSANPQGEGLVSSVTEDFQKHDSVYAGMLGEQTGEEIFR